jgi:glutamate N-acetyltransferase/amino-acid N-acetyltransferase
MNTSAFHGPPRFPPGFRCASTRCGIKKRGRDLSLFVSDVPCAAAAVFTRNRLPGAPILVGRELIQGGSLQAVVVNSRVANVGTGAEGIARARRMGAGAARELGIRESLVLMSSTGVIGVPLPIEKIEAGLRGLSAELQDDPIVGAEGIMTTDTHPKALSVSFPAETGEATLTAVGKGSGMIAPNMATMLVYLFTDARLDPSTLDRSLRPVVDRTFNMLSVDGDTSTSDTCVIMASGHAGAVDEGDFRRALAAVAERMTELLARDGEGANRLFRVTVTGAVDEAEARIVARSLVNSPLMKTMVNGGDPNVGRILMAVGKCVDCQVESERLEARIGETVVMTSGVVADFDDPVVRAALLDDPVDISVDLGIGSGESRAWGCDLSLGYIQENAAYYST